MAGSKAEDQSKLVPKALGLDVVKQLEAQMPGVIAELNALHLKNREARLAREAACVAKRSSSK